MATDKYTFQVEMTCEGCSNAISRLLKKKQESGDVADFTVDLASQKVSVMSQKSQAEIQSILEKSGKKVSYLGDP